MDTNALKKFAQGARNQLIDQVTARLDMVLSDGAAARREHPAAIRKLEAAVAASRPQVIDQAAYTWFNRFTALRFMDATGLTNPRVVSPAEGATRPEILAEALAGNLPDGARPEIAEYLNGTRPAHDGQAEAYRLLVIHACNDWHGPMPFMFERAEDYTELLMPDDLLSQTSILARLREVMTEEACKDVEIIGWLYQFYISEKKDQVFAGLKKNVKITAENIPAATQLFTPHWIVRYLVENSLGRLWLLNRPQSELTAKMDYYIAPVEPETDFLRITGPEEIRICDPACGSGHMLTYAFDLLYEIYAEEGHDAAEIPGLILKHNLTGIEIDDRAGALAAFALSMKAAARLGRRRFLRMEARPRIEVLQNVTFTPAEMQDVAAVVGKDLFSDELCETLGQFEQAKNFGSLIVPKLRDPAETLRVIQARDFDADLLLRPVLERLEKALQMAEALSPKYHVVVANPPYMGGKGMNERTADFLRAHYNDVRHDLFSAFMVRNTQIAVPGAQLGFMTPFVWMFLSSYELLRIFLLDQKTLTSLIQLEYSGFDGATVPICTFTVQNSHGPDFLGGYVKLSDFRGASQQAPRALEAIRDPSLYWFHRATARQFEKIPGYPISFWVSEDFRDKFKSLPSIADEFSACQGLSTSDNPRFVRFWFEVPRSSFNLPSNDLQLNAGLRWHAYNKGGDFRRWYGNREFVVDWKDNGFAIKSIKPKSVVRNESRYHQASVSWSDITSSKSAFRLYDDGFIFANSAHSAFSNGGASLPQAAALLNSNVVDGIIKAISPTFHFDVGYFSKLPYARVEADGKVEILKRLSKSDWDAYETSWDFTTLPLLQPEHRAEALSASYANLRAHWAGMTDEMQRLEQENNRIFIDAYGLQDELTPEVTIEEITLTCNPAYRYGVKGAQEDREARLRQETVEELLHYAVGCMFGRYSLDAPGLILANQGQGVEDYLARIPEPTFAPDRDNVIPVLDADWFADDIVSRARDFLRVSFGEAKFRENLAFVEAALGKDLRRWFTKDFFDYHVRRYKKRPIYWMFSSPKGSFNALIYMHRYRPDTVSVVLNQYLREFIAKLEVERGRLEKLADDPTATPAQRTRAQKEVGAGIKQIDELTAWERNVVYPMAQQKIAIDLDDGVKRNYPLFSGALKPIKGLEAVDD